MRPIDRNCRAGRINLLWMLAGEHLVEGSLNLFSIFRATPTRSCHREGC